MMFTKTCGKDALNSTNVSRISTHLGNLLLNKYSINVTREQALIKLTITT